MFRYSLMLIAVFFLSAETIPEKKQKPTIYIIGDSTVKNGSGKGEGGLWGWGNYLHTQFDTLKVSIRNYALGGRSSRTFISEGLWDKVLAKLQPGDYVLIQFGHNDSSPVNDNSRARGTLSLLAGSKEYLGKRKDCKCFRGLWEVGEGVCSGRKGLFHRSEWNHCR